MECLICPLKESMICSIFPCAISVLFTDWDKNQEGFICQKQKFKAERGIQSPESQLEPTQATSAQDGASRCPAVTGLRGTQRADSVHGPRPPLNQSTVHSKIKACVPASCLLEDLPFKATADVQKWWCKSSLPSSLSGDSVVGKQGPREGTVGWFGSIALTHIHHHAWLAAQSLGPVPLLAPWTMAHQAPPSMGFSRQECWTGLPLLTPADLPGPGMEPTSLRSPALTGGFFTTRSTSEAPFLKGIVSGKPLCSARELGWVLCEDLEGWEGGHEGGDICVLIADSLFFTVETSTTLQSSYIPIKKKNKKFIPVHRRQYLTGDFIFIKICRLKKLKLVTKTACYTSQAK